MLTWDRAAFDQRCGRCGQPIARGEPRLVITIARCEKVRGVCCEGPAPELPAYVPPTPVAITPTPFTPLRSIAASSLPIDWRRRQAGDDDGDAA
jgi:hypothetical protein